ncbi:Mitogen-activated protein kinase kinase kinase [Sesamum alatum]|uniref:Mitogen-activated protein kinase kinase kinase n=1 Tax=Sesamum alatum TaxID=300844 RepID=A0AAE1Y738_9LAMI|nr:Mitogen-activated protein kinase kinase kinase [Sesamum alatum]
MGLVHCDIKGQNILNRSDGLKIVGSFCVSKDASLHGIEVARGEEQSFLADIWTFVVRLFTNGDGSNQAGDEGPCISPLQNRMFRRLSRIPQLVSDNSKDLLAKCLRRDPKERLMAA